MRNRTDFAGLNPSALLSAVLIAAFGAGCKVYDQGWLEQGVEVAGTGQVIGTGGTGGVAGEGTPDSGSPPFDPADCQSGDCWWSHGTPDGCHSAALPEPDARPKIEDAAPLSDLYLGLWQVRIGATAADGLPNDMAWQSIGFDLDGTCTNSATCGGVVQKSCATPPPAIAFDGEGCRDNSLGGLQPAIAVMPELDAFGISEGAINCQLWRGGYNIVVRISGYNGKPDDPHVRVDYYLSTGLEEATAWNCPVDDFMRYPRWRSGRTWSIDDSALSGPIAGAGTLPDSKFADADAYVKNGYVVARVPDGTRQGFIGNGKPYRGFVFTTQRGLFVGRLEKGQDDTWQVSDGLLGGRIRRDDLIHAYRESGFCETGEVLTFYQIMLDYVNDSVDVLASGENDSAAPCDALSFAFGFKASQLVPGEAVTVPKRVECCAPGRDVSDCDSGCGDGMLGAGEKCDTAIPPGAPGACPTMCPLTDACAPQQRSGNGCSATCVPLPITVVGVKDGCCPTGANTTTDGDCKATCGNNVLEPGETCDPPSKCELCGSTSRCVPVTVSGSAETCNLRCEYKPIDSCIPNDGCCPATCSHMAGATQDNDCSSTCGNDMLERNETCDNSSNRPCGTSCDDNDGCTKDIPTGSAENCSFQCSYEKITALIDGDKCCPAGSSANEDSDCTPKCGNGVLEAGEQCDDGNTTAGDGCEACKKQTPPDGCLAQIGDDACGRCVCTRCTSPVLNCYSADARIAGPCSALVNCSRKEHCGTPDCYCGTVSLFTCLAGGANGKCMKETTDAAETTMVTELQGAATDMNNPLGRANALFTCMDMNCRDACSPNANMTTAADAP